MKSRPRSPYLKHLIQDLPRCRICGQLLILTCNQSKPSELKEFIGTLWTKTKPQFGWFYPSLSVEEQSDLCFYHQTQQKEKRR